jgi:hypothetical protein
VVAEHVDADDGGAVVFHEATGWSIVAGVALKKQ